MVETFNNSIKRNFIDYDMLIVDECHIGNFKKIYQHYEKKIIIGFSATPISATKRHPMNADYQAIVCGIDTHELISSGNLVRAKTYAPSTGLNKNNLKMSRGDYAIGAMGQEFSKPKLIDAVCDAYLHHSPGTKAVCFNTTIEHSLLVNDAMLSRGINSRHLDSNCTKEEREDALLWLKNTPGAVLNNVGILTTGFDEASIETIILNRCTKSLPLYLQMCGRGSRPYPGKTHFNIIDLGDNQGMHGFWAQKRDWAHYFHHPDMPGEGVPPVKECPACEAMIHASLTQCPECGHLMPRVTTYSQDPIVLKLIEDLQTEKLIEKAEIENYKPMWGMYRIIEKIKKSNVPENIKKEVFMQKTKEFYKKSGKRLYQNNINFWQTQYENTY